MIQGIFRSNYVSSELRLCRICMEQKSTTTAAILSAILVPMYNFLAVVGTLDFRRKEGDRHGRRLFLIL